MCSIIVINHHYKQFPLVIAANRDEALSRKTSPIQVISEDPIILGQKDASKGGTYLAVNQHSLFAAITNQGTKSPKLLSRGLIPLEVLKAKSLDEMISIVEELNPSLYNKFNLVFGNQKTVFVAHSYILHSMVINELPKGVSLITNDVQFNIPDDEKRCVVHTNLDSHIDTPWLDYYKELKSVLADTESGMKVKPKKNEDGKYRGRCTRASNILAFDNDGLVRYKHFDRTALKPKKGEIRVPRYKDHIDEFRELIGAKKIESVNEETDEEQIMKTAINQTMNSMNNWIVIDSFGGKI